MPAANQATSAASNRGWFVVKKPRSAGNTPCHRRRGTAQRVELELRPWNEFLVAAWWHTDVDRNRPAEGEAVIAFHSLWGRDGVELWALRCELFRSRYVSPGQFGRGQSRA